MSSTLVIIKPDAVHCQNAILERLTCQGKYQVARTKMLWPPLRVVEAHYAEHKGKDFFLPLCNFMTSGLVSVVELHSPNDKDIVKQVRQMLGRVGEKGTLRGDYGSTTQHNAVHASDSDESAKREIALWFPDLMEVAADAIFMQGIETLYQKEDGTFLYVAGQPEYTISEEEGKEWDEKKTEGYRPFTHQEWLDSSTRWKGPSLQLFEDQFSGYHIVGEKILAYVEKYCIAAKFVKNGMQQPQK